MVKGGSIIGDECIIQQENLKLVGTTDEGEVIEVPLVSAFRGDISLESEEAKIKRLFFKRVDEWKEEQEKKDETR